MSKKIQKNWNKSFNDKKEKNVKKKCNTKLKPNFEIFGQICCMPEWTTRKEEKIRKKQKT